MVIADVSACFFFCRIIFAVLINLLYMTESPIIFFDGTCNLCNGAVQFIIKRDKNNLFRFSSLQSDFFRQISANFLLGDQRSDSILLLENGRFFDQSTAALRIAKNMSGMWPLLYGFTIIPTFIRNAIYRFIARHRYQWFGKRESCWVPTPELRSKFLD